MQLNHVVFWGEMFVLGFFLVGFFFFWGGGLIGGEGHLKEERVRFFGNIRVVSSVYRYIQHVSWCFHFLEKQTFRCYFLLFSSLNWKWNSHLNSGQRFPTVIKCYRITQIVIWQAAMWQGIPQLTDIYLSMGEIYDSHYRPPSIHRLFPYH